MRIKAIITGSTGMVGEGVLQECLLNPDVESILLINRKHYEIKHPKVREVIHLNFFDYTTIKHLLKGYNACFFCLGVSSIGMKEEDYDRTTYGITMALANTLVQLNPYMVFCYVSGVGTDSTEKGRIMWARVKGKTENHLLQLPFRKAYMFRPGFIKPTKNLKNTHSFYKILMPLFPLFKLLFPNSICTLTEIGRAMINSINKDFPKNILEVKDIKELAR
jgi:hypothetical protein